MTRKQLGLTALVCLATLPGLATADRGEPAVTEETIVADSLRGTWEVVSVEFMGQKMELPKGQEQTLTFENGKVTMKQAMRNETGSYRTNEARSLKEIDLTTPKNGNPKNSETMKGVYRIDGDTLKLAFTMPGTMTNRPSGFDAKDIGIVVLKRKK